MLLKNTNGLIGNHSKENFTELGSDSYESFQKNLKNSDETWYYRHNVVTYKRNSCGHRCIELNDLPTDFILFVGCSITVGSSVELEKTYPYLVGRKMNMPYYNLAIEGSGIDLLAYNLSTFLTIKKPKYIIVQWPEIYRTFRFSEGKVSVLGPWSNDESFKTLMMTEYPDHYSDVIKSIIRNLIPIIEVNVPLLDFGRDLKHPGISSHHQASEEILSKLNNLGQ